MYVALMLERGKTKVFLALLLSAKGASSLNPKKEQVLTLLHTVSVLLVQRLQPLLRDF